MFQKQYSNTYSPLPDKAEAVVTTSCFLGYSDAHDHVFLASWALTTLIELDPLALPTIFLPVNSPY